jgi:uncharacterized membrane protein YesL
MHAWLIKSDPINGTHTKTKNKKKKDIMRITCVFFFFSVFLIICSFNSLNYTCCFNLKAGLLKDSIIIWIPYEHASVKVVRLIMQVVFLFFLFWLESI